MEDAEARRKRKAEAKQQKRKRTEEAGGVRPRKEKTTVVSHENDERSAAAKASKPSKKRTHAAPSNSLGRNGGSVQSFSSSRHRFGRVMEQAPCRNQPRFSTLSIALPGSVVSNCQTRELKTQLVGQVARAASIYHVDEVIVFNDQLAKSNHKGYYNSRQNHSHGRDRRGDREEGKDDKEKVDLPDKREHRASDPHSLMARLLQYCECPQYLRRHFFPMHPDLQFAGLLCPIDAPHHVRVEDRSKYREGVVMDKKGTGPNAGSFVNCGIRNRPVEIDRVLSAGIRCTVELDPKAYGSAGRIRGKVVSPSAPMEDDGTYWGYTTRLAESINDVFDACPYEGGYDLKIGTSERGDVTVDDGGFSLPPFKHALLVFGGVAGIEECVDADETLRIPGSESRKLFDMWLNICPFQGSRTIRTEEAVLIGLSRLSPFVAANILVSKPNREAGHGEGKQESLVVEFSDDAPSDESSDDGGD